MQKNKYTISRQIPISGEINELGKRITNDIARRGNPFWKGDQRKPLWSGNILNRDPRTWKSKWSTEGWEANRYKGPRGEAAWRCGGSEASVAGADEWRLREAADGRCQSTGAWTRSFHFLLCTREPAEGSEQGNDNSALHLKKDPFVPGGGLSRGECSVRKQKDQGSGTCSL